MCALLLGFSANALEPLQPITVRPAGVLGRQGNRDVSMSRQAISADGRFVVLSTTSSNLVPDELGRVQDVFVVDTDPGELTAISRRPDGGEANGDSDDAVISGDGRWVAFTSTATI